MSQILCAKPSTLRSAVLRLSLVGTLGLAVMALGNTGCEDKHIGRACDVLTEAGADLCYRELPDLSHTYPRSENGAILSWFEAHCARAAS